MKTAVPEEVGFSAQRLRQIDKVMQSYVDQNKLAGVVALVARHGRSAYCEQFGMMDLEASKPMQFDTIFRIYSMTKPITSVGAMMLYEQGYFDLNDPVSKFIPEFADLKVFVSGSEDAFETKELAQEITIKHLLTHTSGLSAGFFEDSPVELMYAKQEFSIIPVLKLQIPLKEMVQRLVKLPLITQPGTAWRYSKATDVLGYLVEIISGLPLNEFFEEKIFKPLGMKDTGFYVPEVKLERLATLYGPGENGGFELLDSPLSSQFSQPTDCLSGGAGLVSTASDYMRFAQMLLNGGELNGTRLLGRKTINLMSSNHLPDDLIPIQLGSNTLHGCGFGLGFRVLVDVAQAGQLGTAGEYGWGGYASTSFFVDPDENLIGLVLTQLAPSYTYPIRDQMKVLVYQALVD
jgi:CubicO group peptidase (beta-lactamase class C family)